MAHVNVRLQEGYKTEVFTRGIMTIADEPIEAGGTNAGLSPTEMVLGGLGACAAITARFYAERKGWKLDSVEIALDSTKFKSADYPAYEGTADILFEIKQMMRFNGDLTDEQKDRLREIAGKCPVHKMFTSPTIMVEQIVDDLILDESR